jgi:hypothetical protein
MKSLKVSLTNGNGPINGMRQPRPNRPSVQYGTIDSFLGSRVKAALVVAVRRPSSKARMSYVEFRRVNALGVPRWVFHSS